MSRFHPGTMSFPGVLVLFVREVYLVEVQLAQFLFSLSQQMT